MTGVYQVSNYTPCQIGLVKGERGENGANGANGVNGKDGKDGKDGLRGLSGSDGKSNYQLALDAGFIGSLADYQAELRGVKGEDGTDATIDFLPVVTGAAGTPVVSVVSGTPSARTIALTIPKGDDGVDGKSAYQSALDNGFIGTEAEWKLYLKSDGSIQALQQFMTNPASTEVSVPDYGNIPSLQGYISTMFENGGLPAKPFQTKALMTASALVDGDYAQVTDGGTDNGLYLKTAGTWVKSAYDPLSTASANNNPLFKPKELTASDDLDSLPTGIYFVNTALALEGITGLPLFDGAKRLGVVIVYRYGLIGYQQFQEYKSLQKKERVGNGGSSGFAYGAWTDVVNQAALTTLNTNLSNAISTNALEINKKPTLNLAPNTSFTDDGAETYQGISTTENGFKTLVMNTGSVSIVQYDLTIDNKYFSVGDTVEFKAEGFSDVASTKPTIAKSADIAVIMLSSSGSTISTATSSTLVANSWTPLSLSVVIPSDTAKIRFRFVHRNLGNISKFRKFVVTTNAYASSFVSPPTTTETLPAGGNTYYVAKSGNNANSGSKLAPFLTIQKAVDALTNGGHVIVLDSADYREALSITSDAHIKISASKGNRVNIFGSDKLVVTKTSGYTKVYQAPLAAKPTGLGGVRGLPMIFEWGTKSKPIIESERHFLQRGLTHRLPYTEMLEAASIAELDTVNGKWFWQDGIIYFSATDGSDAGLKRYEARVRACLTHTNGSVELDRVTSWFSDAYGMLFSGLSVNRKMCMSYGSKHNGFADNANLTISYKDISGGAGNDGFNMTVLSSKLGELEVGNRLEGIYFDPYGHDNGDDGISCHFRSDATVYGGLFEYNTKADVVHVTGSQCVCYDTEVRGTENGFYAMMTPTNDSERVKSVFRCVNTKSTDNNYAYRQDDDAILICDNTLAVNPRLWGYSQNGTGSLIANDAKYIGDALKAKTGNVTINNSNALV